MLRPPMKLYIDIFGPDKAIIEAALNPSGQTGGQTHDPIDHPVFDNHYFASDFYPESLVIPEIRAIYEEQYYWYSTSPVLVFSHTETTAEQIIFYSIAKSEAESEILIKMVSRLRALTLPIRTSGNRLLPPPRIWITYWDKNWNTAANKSGNNQGGETNEYRMHFGTNKFRILAVVEAVLYQIMSSFPNGLPRIIETTLTFKEIVRPYKTVTFNEVFEQLTLYTEYLDTSKKSNTSG